jgi:hypothetical protein
MYRKLSGAELEAAVQKLPKGNNSEAVKAAVSGVRQKHSELPGLQVRARGAAWFGRGSGGLAGRSTASCLGCR